METSNHNLRTTRATLEACGSPYTVGLTNQRLVVLVYVTMYLMYLGKDVYSLLAKFNDVCNIFCFSSLNPQRLVINYLVRNLSDNSYHSTLPSFHQDAQR